MFYLNKRFFLFECLFYVIVIKLKNQLDDSVVFPIGFEDLLRYLSMTHGLPDRSKGFKNIYSDGSNIEYDKEFKDYIRLRIDLFLR